MKKLSKGLLFLLKLFVVVLVNSITVIVGAVPFFLLLFFIQLALSVFIDSFSITSYTTKILLLLSLTGSLIYLMLHYIFMDMFERLEKKKLRKKWKEKIKDPLDVDNKK